ncbi:hypothetical protein GS966_28975 [Rhodococcus hoagii]|nr:hypothetical protein [Prescottella equi]
MAARWLPAGSAWSAVPMSSPRPGAALGGALGANITNAYVSEDKSFAIEKFRDGPGTPSIVARGFTTGEGPELEVGHADGRGAIPGLTDLPLRWGSKELSKLAALS